MFSGYLICHDVGIYRYFFLLITSPSKFRCVSSCLCWFPSVMIVVISFTCPWLASCYFPLSVVSSSVFSLWLFPVFYLHYCLCSLHFIRFVLGSAFECFVIPWFLVFPSACFHSFCHLSVLWYQLFYWSMLFVPPFAWLMTAFVFFFPAIIITTDTKN